MARGKKLLLLSLSVFANMLLKVWMTVSLLFLYVSVCLTICHSSMDDCLFVILVLMPVSIYVCLSF